MNLRELYKRKAELIKEFDMSKDTKSVEELKPIIQEMREVQEKIDMAEEVKGMEVEEEVEEKVVAERSVESLNEEELDKEYRSAFVTGLRRRKLTERQQEVVRAKNAPTVGHFKSEVDEDGGYIVPKDVSTQINHYKRAFAPLEDLVTVVYTNALSGSRTFEKLADATPFENVSEYDVINEFAAPQYETKTYKISAYAGILPIPNTLLQDTDNNLLSEVTNFIARKTVATRNFKILAKLDEIYTTKTKVATADDLKDILNVELDPAFAVNAYIVTNQDGFNYLDKLKDKDGNYLLQRDVANPTKFVALGKEVKVYPNRVIKTVGKKAPIYVGDFKEAITLFDRNVIEVLATNVGGDAFKRNTTDVRVIDRFDVQGWDKDALVRGEIDLSKPQV